MASNARAATVAEGLRRVTGGLRRRFREQSCIGELSWAQFSMLSRLEREGPSTVTTLARAEGMRPQSMGASISALEELGHVQASPDPKDGRQTLWSVTPKCRALVQAARAAKQDWLVTTIQKKFSQSEQDDLAQAMQLLERLADGGRR
ncbi:MAG TPA: MarR family transcriptional regulator [Rhizomicrobium sp.]|jgi:DNA-binding MarR family transcriptional regulator